MRYPSLKRTWAGSLLAAVALMVACSSQTSPHEAQGSSDPVIRPQVCWGPNAIATTLGEPAGSVYAPWRRRSIQPAEIGDGRLRHLMRGSVIPTLRHDWRQIVDGGGDGAEQVVLEGREAASELIADPSLIRRPGTLRETFAEAQATATESGFSFCTLDD